MKKLGLVIVGIKSFKKNNPIVFCIYIIGYMLMCFVFIYVYTNYMPSVIDGADNQVDRRYYKFIISEDNYNCDYEQLYKYLRTYEPLYCNLSTYVSIKDLTGGNEEEKISVMTRLDNAFETYKFDVVDNPGRVNKALVNNEKIIVLLENLDYTEKTLTIEDDEFEVVIAAWDEFGAVLSFSNYCKYFKPEFITIVVGETLRNGRHEEFLNRIQNEFGFLTLYEPSEIMNDADYEMNMYYSRLIVIVFGVAVCIFMFLIRFLLEYSKYEYTIYRLVGAKYDTVTSLVFSQTIVINVALIILSIAIYELFYNAFFEKINMYRDIHMKIRDYVFMTGILMLFSAIAIIPFIIYSLRNSISKCINYYS